eukprot:UN25007
MKMTLKKEFVNSICSVAFHPSGLHILVGFSDKLRLMNILLDDLCTYKEFHKIRNCSECRFANGGQYFAAANNDKIHVVNAYSGQLIQLLRGHTQRVKSLFFTPDDNELISSGLDGSVYQWKISTGDRLQEFPNRQCPVESSVYTADGKLFTVGLNGQLREIMNGQLERSIDMEIGMTSMVIGHEVPQRIFIIGTTLGLLRSMKYPITSDKEMKEFCAHEGAITRMVITRDDTLLFTTGADGCIIAHEIKTKRRSNEQKGEK